MGGSIGLTVAKNMRERFARIVMLNVALPVGKFRNDQTAGHQERPSLYKEVQSFLPQINWKLFMHLGGKYLPVSILLNMVTEQIPENIAKAYKVWYNEIKEGLALFANPLILGPVPQCLVPRRC